MGDLNLRNKKISLNLHKEPGKERYSGKCCEVILVLILVLFNSCLYLDPGRFKSCLDRSFRTVHEFGNSLYRQLIVVVKKDRLILNIGKFSSQDLIQYVPFCLFHDIGIRKGFKIIVTLCYRNLVI